MRREFSSDPGAGLMIDIYRDFTNVTELEKFTASLSKFLFKTLNQKREENSRDKAEDIEEDLIFRMVPFKLTVLAHNATQSTSSLAGIPHLQWAPWTVGRLFDRSSVESSKTILLKCQHPDRLLSESTARLLLSSLIQAARVEGHLCSFTGLVQYGNELDHSYVGFRTVSDENEFVFSQWRDSTSLNPFKNTECLSLKLKWFCGGEFIGAYPSRRFSAWGFFRNWCPIELISLQVVWPKLSANSPIRELEGSTKRVKDLCFSEDALIEAPIWLLSGRLQNREDWPQLRGSCQRALITSHLRHIFTQKQQASGHVRFDDRLVAIKVFSSKAFQDELSGYWEFLQSHTSLDRLYTCVGGVYVQEVRRMETEGSTLLFSGLGLLQSLRVERLNERLSALWRAFLGLLEDCWRGMKCFEVNSSVSELEKAVGLLNWCIERERSWHEAILARGLDPDDVIPALPNFSFCPPTIDDEIEEVRQRIIGKLSQKAQQPQEESTETQGVSVEFETEFDFGPWRPKVPLTLSCEPPPPRLHIASLLKNPVAGEVIALNQLKADIAAFKAANEDLVAADDELAFTAFLSWHSPNDVEVEDDGEKVSSKQTEPEHDETARRPKISQRMADPKGQWCQLWREVKAAPLNPATFSSHVSFNHRSLAGQVLSDLALKFTLQELLECAVPFITLEMAKEMHLKPERVDAIIEESVGFPFDVLSPLIDEAEAQLSIQSAVKALSSAFTAEMVLEEDAPLIVTDDALRRSLLQRKKFEIVEVETVNSDSYAFREDSNDLVFEAKVERLSY